jgi:hypothetical protein
MRSCSPSPIPGGSAAEWVPLLDHIVQLVMRSCGAPSREGALDMLAVRNLVWLPNIHIYLNSVLRHKKVGGTPSISRIVKTSTNVAHCAHCWALPSW